MKQQSKLVSTLSHLYPGVLTTVGFTVLAPLAIQFSYPPQMGMLLSIVVVALPVLTIHLLAVKRREGAKSIFALNGLTEKLPLAKLVIYSLGLVVFAFLMWGVTQPLHQLISTRFLSWLPAWYTVQDFSGYSRGAIQQTLVLNLVLNGLLAPVIEEIYFRGYLLPRMAAFGKYAFVFNALLFSLYHFWQPQVYLTLFLALLPMTYFVQRTRDLRLAILTHCLLNLLGALLTLAAV